MNLDELNATVPSTLVPHHAFGSLDRPTSVYSRAGHRIFLMNPTDGTVVVKELSGFVSPRIHPDHGMGGVRA